MLKKINPINIATNTTDYTFEYPTPGKCSMCKNGTDATPLASFSVPYEDSSCHVYILFFCHSCETCFIGAYRCFNPTYGYRNELDLIGFAPRGENVSDFSDRIYCVSPKFVEIYRQSEKAEQWGLSEICGMGYRKALEFLVKDFAIALSPDDEDVIKSKLLSPCINDHIDNKRIKSLAKASAWIGNDETHYTRKHDDYNTESLKSFINAMVTFIDSELAFIDAENLINKK